MPDVLDSFLFAESNCAILGFETTPPFYMLGVRTPFTYRKLRHRTIVLSALDTICYTTAILCGLYTSSFWQGEATSGPLNRVSPRPAVANQMQWKKCKIVQLGVSRTGVQLDPVTTRMPSTQQICNHCQANHRAEGKASRCTTF